MRPDCRGRRSGRPLRLRQIREQIVGEQPALSRGSSLGARDPFAFSLPYTGQLPPAEANQTKTS